MHCGIGRNRGQGWPCRLLAEDRAANRRQFIAGWLVARRSMPLNIDVTLVERPRAPRHGIFVALRTGRVVEVRPETVLRRKVAAEDRQAGRESLELAGRQVRERIAWLEQWNGRR